MACMYSVNSMAVIDYNEDSEISIPLFSPGAQPLGTKNSIKNNCFFLYNLIAPYTMITGYFIFINVHSD